FSHGNFESESEEEKPLDVARKSGGVQPKTQAVSSCYFLDFKPQRRAKKGAAHELASAFLYAAKATPVGGFIGWNRERKSAECGRPKLDASGILAQDVDALQQSLLEPLTATGCAICAGTHG